MSGIVVPSIPPSSLMGSVTQQQWFRDEKNNGLEVLTPNSPNLNGGVTSRCLSDRRLEVTMRIEEL